MFSAFISLINCLVLKYSQDTLKKAGQGRSGMEYFPTKEVYQQDRVIQKHTKRKVIKNKSKPYKGFQNSLCCSHKPSTQGRRSQQSCVIDPPFCFSPPPFTPAKNSHWTIRSLFLLEVEERYIYCVHEYQTAPCKSENLSLLQLYPSS